MQLKYPTARLLIVNLLHNGADNCTQAIIEGAGAVGLIRNPDEIKRNGDGCDSSKAILEIVDAYFSQRHPTIKKTDKMQIVSGIMNNINQDVRQYALRSGFEHPEESSDRVHCRKMAPIVFDFLLQHVGYFD